MNIPEDLRYTREHEWVRLEGGKARIGITDFAQETLGDVVYVEIPEVGTEVRSGEAFGEVESTKSVSDVFAPVTGTVSERNDSLADAPELLNQDPYGRGWMAVVELADPSGTQESLISAQEYAAFVATQAEE